MKKGIIPAIGVLAVLGFAAGCHHCPPPEESLDCYPICCRDRNANARDVKADWERFKKTPHYPFIPTGRYPKIDALGRVVSDLSYHVKYDIVIPYLELDRDGLICEFYEFQRDAAAARDKLNVDQQTAMKLTWECWMRQPDGPAKCQRLVNAIPLLHRLSVNNQIRVAVLKLGPQAAEILILFLRDPEFKHESKAIQHDFNRALNGDARAMDRLARMISLIPSLKSLISSIGFLGIYLNDKSSQREALEQFILDIDRMSKDGEQHNM